MSARDGGSAYPVMPIFDERRGEYAQYAEPGMSLRQAYKLAALQALQLLNQPSPVFVRVAAQSCAAYADAMLKEDAEHAAKESTK